MRANAVDPCLPLKGAWGLGDESDAFNEARCIQCAVWRKNPFHCAMCLWDKYREAWALKAVAAFGSLRERASREDKPRTCSSCAHWAYTGTTPDPPDCEPVEWGDCRVSGDPRSEYAEACEAWAERSKA